MKCKEGRWCKNKELRIFIMVEKKEKRTQGRNARARKKKRVVKCA